MYVETTVIPMDTY